MEILYLAHRLPYPPNKGEKIRSFHQIRHLARNHTLHLVSFIDRQEDFQHVDALRKYCATVDAVYRRPFRSLFRCMWSLASGVPLTLGYFKSQEILGRVQDLIKLYEIDRIMVFSSCMVQYVMDYSGIPKVVDLVDVDSEKWTKYSEYKPFPLSWLYALEGNRLRRYEKAILEGFAHCVVVSEREATLCHRIVPEKTVSVIPNGVDIEYYQPSPNGGQPSTLVFTGAMDYFPNVDGMIYFCREIFPKIQKRVPQVKLYIVGRDPKGSIKELGKIKGIVVTGEVDDVRPYLHAASVCVVPLRIACGIQNKILEAMAMGLPVVATPSAIQGICAVPDRDLFVEGSPEKFAGRVTSLLMDEDLRRHISGTARRLVERNYSWDHPLQHLERLLEISG